MRKAHTKDKPSLKLKAEQEADPVDTGGRESDDDQEEDLRKVEKAAATTAPKKSDVALDDELDALLGELADGTTGA